jgi:hypothetical protein
LAQNALAAAYQKGINPQTGEVNNSLILSELAKGGAGHMIPDVQAKLLKAQQEEAVRKKAEFDLTAARRKFGDELKRNLSANPSNENVISWGQDAVLQGIYTPEQVDMTVKQLLDLTPDARRTLLAQAGATAGELKPQIVTENLGNTSRVSAVPAFGGAPTTLSESKKTMTEYEKGHLAVQQGQLRVAQDRLAKEGAGLDPAENAAISKAIIEGRLDPNRVNGRNAKILATTLLSNPDANVLELGVSAAGATASEKSLATQTAKMSTAANEANKMVDVVRELSDKVDRSEFPSLNAISNAVAKGTGSKEIVQLNTSINALVNSYARAISPTGAPTVSDKNHAREVINSAYSQGQLGAILDVMQQEMAISREAAGTASSELKASREAARGRGPTPATTGGLSPAEQAELQQLRARFGK